MRQWDGHSECVCQTDVPAIYTTAELRGSGHTRRTLQIALETGSLNRIRRGVYADPAACEDAVRAARHGGPLACVSAALHLGLWVLRAEGIHVWLRHGGHEYPKGNPGPLVPHWDDDTRQTPFGLPDLPRILRQILSCYGVEDFFVALESAMYQGRLSPTDRAWLSRNTNEAGREALRIASSLSESGLESLLKWRLRHLAVRVRSQVSIVSVGRVDVLIGDRLIIEVDGKPNHTGPHMRHKDLVRDANAASWGYHTLRFDYSMLVHDWPTVEAAILARIDAGVHLN